jgi:hypothetical protein
VCLFIDFGSEAGGVAPVAPEHDTFREDVPHWTNGTHDAHPLYINVSIVRVDFHKP